MGWSTDFCVEHLGDSAAGSVEQSQFCHKWIESIRKTHAGYHNRWLRVPFHGFFLI